MMTKLFKIDSIYPFMLSRENPYPNLYVGRNWRGYVVGLSGRQICTPENNGTGTCLETFWLLQIRRGISPGI